MSALAEAVLTIGMWFAGVGALMVSRYHAVERGVPALWGAAVPIGAIVLTMVAILGGLVTTSTEVFAVLGIGLAFLAGMAYIDSWSRGGYAELRELRVEYGPDENWVDIANGGTE